MRTRRVFAPLAAAALVVASCGGGFGKSVSGRRLVVTIVGGDRGSPEKPLPLSFSTPHTVSVRIEARDANGLLDTSYNGTVRLGAKPGAVVPRAADQAATPRTAVLAGGVADNVPVSIVAAYGQVRIWAEDEGEIPVDPRRTPPPACSNGVDDDGDGDADFPLDVGCASPVDDTEIAGSYVGGVSETLFFMRPRIADVRGDKERGAKTPFTSEQVDVDTGYRPAVADFDFNVVVTRISSDGFYATDLDPKESLPYRSIYAFTFSSPTRMRMCDRIKTLTGTATEFFGMTQLASPTFTVEFWNPNVRPCLIPEPRSLAATEVTNTAVLFENAAGLVRVETAEVPPLADELDADQKPLRKKPGQRSIRAASFLGPQSPELRDGRYVFTRDATSCDLNKNGRIDFGGGSPEQTCSDDCKADLDCAEWTGFRDQRNFMLYVEDSYPEEPTVNGRRLPASVTRAKIQADASSAPGFDPLAARGLPLGAFTGTLKYFSGGSQFTIEARCDQDVVAAGEKPLSSDQACVKARTEGENEAL